MFVQEIDFLLIFCNKAIEIYSTIYFYLEIIIYVTTKNNKNIFSDKFSNFFYILPESSFFSKVNDI